jgi:hypothetical protein
MVKPTFAQSMDVVGGGGKDAMVSNIRSSSVESSSGFPTSEARDNRAAASLLALDQEMPFAKCSQDQLAAIMSLI